MKLKVSIPEVCAYPRRVDWWTPKDTNIFQIAHHHTTDTKGK